MTTQSEKDAFSCHRLANEHLEARLMPYGGTLVSLLVPDRQGRMGDVVLGFDHPEEYAGTHPYFGALIGRFANRIARGRFTLDGAAYRLACNEGRHHLHGGAKGFDRVAWQMTPAPARIELSHVSPNGDEGYPGALTVQAAYSLEGNALVLEFRATTDRPTVVNLTQHSYFNLAGGGDIGAHEFRIAAPRYVEVDADRIPTGKLKGVAGTPFDFRRREALGGRAIDHTFVLEGDVEVYEPASGRRLQIVTSEPGLQLYTGDLLDGSVRGKGGTRYGRREGFCLEPQHFPDSPNQPAFPSTVLRPGETYRARTVYRFSAA